MSKRLKFECYLLDDFVIQKHRAKKPERLDDMEPIYNPKLNEQNSTGCMKNNEKKTITKKN